MLARVQDLISIICAQEVSFAERTRTVTSRMDELGGGYKINLPATPCQAVAIVHVFVPCGMKMLVKPARFFVCLPSDHQGGGSNLVHASGPRPWRRNSQALNPEILENKRARRRERPRQVFLANVTARGTGAWMLLHEFFKKLNGARKDLNIGIENQNVRRRCPSEGLVHTARKTAIFAEPDEIRTVSKLCRAVQRRIPGSIIDNEDFGTPGCRHDRSIHTRSKSPEFQLMIAIVLLMFHRKHKHDVQWIHSESQTGNSICGRHPRQKSRKAIHNQIQACILADARDSACLEAVLGKQPRNRFGIEEKVMFRNELPPACFEDFKRQRIDIRCLDDKQTARPHSGGRSANEASRRIHMLDDMKTRDDVEIGPRQTLNDVLVHGSDLARCGRQFRIRLNAVGVERFSCDGQKI